MQTHLDFLIIDDNETFASVLARAIGRQGFTVICLHSAVEASVKLQTHPKSILLDLNLNGDNGLLLLPQLCKHYPNAKIVVLTGFASIATAVKAVKMGAIQYLSKPVTVDEILNALEEDTNTHADVSISNQIMSVKRVTWEHIQRVLVEQNGNISATARVLNMHRRTLQRMLAKKPVNK